MRIFVAGATGAIGRQLVPMLLEAGHRVTGTTRSAEKADGLLSIGADAVVVDAFHANALCDAVAAARPQVVIHQLTDLAAGFDPDQLRANTLLRRVGTTNLVAAALAAGARRMVAQSGAWLYAPGATPYVEAAPLKDPIAHPEDPALPGIIELERLVTGIPGLEGVVLRYGFLYGPGTVRDSPGEEPGVHVTAAARAAALAIDHGPPGIYNIVDDGGSVSNRRARELLGWEPTRELRK